MWSLLVTLDQYNHSVEVTRTGPRISKVLMTGLGTGTGRVSAKRCAQQMALAIRDFCDASAHPEKWGSMDWDDAIQSALDGRATHQL